MADNLPVPSPSTEAASTAPPSPSPAAVASPSGRAHTEGVQPSLNGASKAAGANDQATPQHTFQQWLLLKAIHLGALLLIWGVAFLVLSLYGLKVRNAIGFATVVSVVAAFFIRSLLPFATPKSLAAPASTPQPPTDSVREVIETVVFVVVLVLLLKSFAAEAFVIPTGSMAQTLWGYQKVVTCPQCGLEFPVNCSTEVDPSEGSPAYVSGCICPNCRQQIEMFRVQDGPREPRLGMMIPDPGWGSGDRVLVAKFVYDLLGKQPDRLDVVVFKFPGDNKFPHDSGPVKKHVPMNYIKRLIGLPGETIAIHRGKLYVLGPTDELKYDDMARTQGDPNKMLQLWRLEHTHHDDKDALRLFKEGRFEMIRKNPAALLAMMRLVYDNDHQAKDLMSPEYARWVPGSSSGWSADGKTAFRNDGSTSETGWLRYRHVLRGSPGQAQLITDFMGYNTWQAGGAHHPPGENWASDLIVECDVAVQRPQGSFTLELSKASDRFQARFDLAQGECTLLRLTDGQKPVELKTARSRIASKGTYSVRFANVDDRLTVWVNDRLIFGDGVEYRAAEKQVPQKHNDLERPVSVGSDGAAIQVSKLKVYRDTYYTSGRNASPAAADVPEFRSDDPETWKHFETLPEPSTYYVQPGHYLCMGDNSPESSDGRSWGLVPQRLLLGRALLIYYPFSRAGRIR